MKEAFWKNDFLFIYYFQLFFSFPSFSFPPNHFTGSTRKIPTPTRIQKLGQFGQPARGLVFSSSVITPRLDRGIKGGVFLPGSKTSFVLDHVVAPCRNNISATALLLEWQAAYSAVLPSLHSIPLTSAPFASSHSTTFSCPCKAATKRMGCFSLFLEFVLLLG